MNQAALNEYEEASRQLIWYLIEDSLGENYSPISYYTKAYYLLDGLKTLDAKCMIYLELKHANDTGLNAAAIVWKRKNYWLYKRMILHIRSIGLFLMLRHWFSVYIFYLGDWA